MLLDPLRVERMEPSEARGEHDAGIRVRAPRTVKELGKFSPKSIRDLRGARVAGLQTVEDSLRPEGRLEY